MKTQSVFNSRTGLFKALAASPLALALVAGSGALIAGFAQPGLSWGKGFFSGNAEQCSWLGGSGFGMFGGPMMILFWVVVIIALVMLIRWLVKGENNTTADREPEALEILKARYARGDIEREEFLRLKQDLTTG